MPKLAIGTKEYDLTTTYTAPALCVNGYYLNLQSRSNETDTICVNDKVPVPAGGGMPSYTGGGGPAWNGPVEEKYFIIEFFKDIECTVPNSGSVLVRLTEGPHTLYYSKDLGATWGSLNLPNSSTSSYTTISSSGTNPIYMYGYGGNFIKKGPSSFDDVKWELRPSSNNGLEGAIIRGNLGALTCDTFIPQTCYNGMFYKNNKLKHIKCTFNTTYLDSRMQSENQNYHSLFSSMFEQCFELETANVVIGNPNFKPYKDCFSEMFYYCPSLIEGPTLIINTDKPISQSSATEPTHWIETSAFYKMFMNCYNLVSIPKFNCMPGNYAYSSMFSGCVSLNCEFSTLYIDNNYCCSKMFSGCSTLNRNMNIASLLDCRGNYAMQEMFLDCTSLNSIVTFPTPKAGPESKSIGICRRMFCNCTSFTHNGSEPQLLKYIPEEGFYGMYYNCKSLKKIHKTDQTIFRKSSFDTMYFGCYSLNLTQSDISCYLQASTRGITCMRSMFEGTNVKGNIILDISGSSTCGRGCFSKLFYRTSILSFELKGRPADGVDIFEETLHYCDSLKSIKVNFTSWDPTAADINKSTYNWNNFKTIHSTRPGNTFICPAALPDVRGTNNIPETWTKVNA